MRLVREVLAAEETRRGTDITAALRFLSNVQKRRAVVFIISDFMDSDYDRELRVISRRHDVICCPVTDPRELQLVNAGLIEVQDPETGELCLLDTSSRQLREAFRAQGEARFQELAQRFRRLKIDTIWGSTDRPFIDDVRKLFKQRQSRVGRA